MSHQVPRKKASGATGRKKRRLAEEEDKKSSKFFETYLVKAGPSSSTSVDLPTPGPSLSEWENGSSTVTSHPEVGDASEIMELTVEEDGGAGDADPVGQIPSLETEAIELEEVTKPESVIPPVIAQHDLGLLQFDKGTGKPTVSDALKIEIVQLGARYFQNSKGPFLPTHNRSMNTSWFKRKMGDGRGEEVLRSWLVYSPSKKSAFCFCCLLFSCSENISTLERESGFSHWKAPERLNRHENARNHLDCFRKWRQMQKNLAEKTGLIDKALQTQIERERQRWRDVLMRIVHCVKFLATQNLAFRGHKESIQQDHDSNVGNFLASIKLLAAFDPVMKEHLGYVESHPGHTSYLSPGVQNEFIHLMASTVRKSILAKIRKAKYYGIIFDSTPDQAHREQMSEVVRYVEVDYHTRTVCVKESFLGFIQIRQKDAASLAEDILKQLEKDELELQDCRSQCYDNAPVMAGHRSGVQQRIIEKNSLAVFVNCNNHSLNLVGVYAAKEDSVMVSFFKTIEALYVFFSRSPLRWEKLKTAVPVVVKSQSETRWSSRIEAVRPIHDHLDKILTLLENMMDDKGESFEIKNDVEELYNHMLSFNFMTVVGFWKKVLISIDRVQQKLQDPTMTFHLVAQDLKFLREHFSEQRESLVSESIKEGLSLCEKWDVEVERRRRRRKMMPGERARDAGLTAKEEMERVLKAALDRLDKEMEERFTRLYAIDSKFGFLLDIERLCYSTEKEDLKKRCEDLATIYCSDINGQLLYEEVLDFRMLIKNRPHDKLKTPLEVLESIVEHGDEDVFPNLRISIKLMLTIAVSVATCERSFSKLKIILSCLRASMGQERLSDLTLLSIEREEIENTNFEEIIDQFAAVKSRKVPL